MQRGDKMNGPGRIEKKIMNRLILAFRGTLIDVKGNFRKKHAMHEISLAVDRKAT